MEFLPGRLSTSCHGRHGSESWINRPNLGGESPFKGCVMVYCLFCSLLLELDLLPPFGLQDRHLCRRHLYHAVCRRLDSADVEPCAALSKPLALTHGSAVKSKFGAPEIGDPEHDAQDT